MVLEVVKPRVLFSKDDGDQLSLGNALSQEFECETVKVKMLLIKVEAEKRCRVYIKLVLPRSSKADKSSMLDTPL